MSDVEHTYVFGVWAEHRDLLESTHFSGSFIKCLPLSAF